MRDPDRPKDAVYIGRSKTGNKWGNPFSHLTKTTLANLQVPSREAAINLYEVWLEDYGLIKDIEEIRGKDLVCWCAPWGGCDENDDLVCHGQILLREANK